MTIQKMEETLSIGGKSNSLSKVDEVIREVLKDKTLLNELYGCMFSQDPWVRMRAADAFEKVCRQHPEWIEPYINKMQAELSGLDQQPSIQWHLAQIYQEVNLTDEQKRKALSWLAKVLSSDEIDWIVAANSMKTLAYFTQNGDFPKDALVDLLRIQLHHKSNTIVKKAQKYINDFA